MADARPEPKSFNFNEVAPPEEKDFSVAKQMLFKEGYESSAPKTDITQPKVERGLQDFSPLGRQEIQGYPTPQIEFFNGKEVPLPADKPEELKRLQERQQKKEVNEPAKDTKEADISKRFHSLKPGECIEGTASHYGDGDRLYGRETASGEIFKRGKNTLALPNYNNALEKPFNVNLINPKTGKTIEARVNDMGPHVRLKRAADLQSTTFYELFGNKKQGLEQIKVCRPK